MRRLLEDAIDETDPFSYEDAVVQDKVVGQRQTSGDGDGTGASDGSVSSYDDGSVGGSGLRRRGRGRGPSGRLVRQEVLQDFDVEGLESLDELGNGLLMPGNPR